MLTCAICSKEAQSKCSKCHVATYCGTVCQTADWKAHKRQCGKPIQNIGGPPPTVLTGHGAWPASYSPFGQVVNPATGQSVPVSHHTKFFVELFGYTVDHPQKTYEELVDAFRLQRLADRRSGSGPTSTGFADYIDKVQASKIVPSWWKDDVHGPELLKFSEADEWARLDRLVDEGQILGRHTEGGKRRTSMIKLRLQMMSERIWGTRF